MLLVLVIACQISSVVLISTKVENIPELLFNLTNYAVESRQFGSAPYPIQHNYVPYPNMYLVPQKSNHESVLDVLATIARNDALNCVPRLLCEVTSDSISRNDNSFSLSNLPFKLDMSSIIRLLTTIDLGTGSPIPVFGKAALLGYVSKGNSESCLDAYPKCPRDPNKLVQYLNNYNGGFFRFFNGLNRAPLPQNYGSLHHPHNYYRPYRYGQAEKRILNKATQYIPNDALIPGANLNLNNRTPKTLTFPNDDDESFNEFTFRKPKELPFSINHYYSNELDLQRPLPNHRATPMIFPDRTGTGDLRLDVEDLNENYQTFYINNQQHSLEDQNFELSNPVNFPV